MKIKLIAIFLACFLLTVGCQKPEEVVILDEETLREIAEFERELEERNATYQMAGNNDPGTVDAINEPLEVSPATQNQQDPENFSSHSEDLSANDGDQNDSEFEPLELPEQGMDKEAITRMIDSSLSNNKGSATTSTLKPIPDFQPKQPAQRNNGQFDIAQDTDTVEPELDVDLTADSELEDDLDQAGAQQASTDSAPAKMLAPATQTPEQVTKPLPEQLATNTGSTSETEIETKPETEIETNAETKTDSSTVSASSLTKHSKPELVCRVFLDALSKSDRLVANRLLTNIAQIETARAELELDAPGGPDAIFQVKPAKYATSAKEVAQVQCLLEQPGEVPPVTLTWMMRFQYNGWKISGMSIQMSEDGPIDLLSFENPKDLARIQTTVDDAPNTRTASSNSATSEPDQVTTSPR